jgi:hypothetical protein
VAGRRTPAAWIVAFASRLRFPALFALALALFVLDLVLPDALPFVDEILLGLAAVALARWRRPADEEGEEGETS